MPNVSSDRMDASPQNKSTASLTDILTAAKNIVTALNTTAKTTSNIAGNTNRPAISTTTAILSQPGRLVSVVVTTAGVAGAVYDASNVSNISANNLVYVIPATLGVVSVGIPMMYGIVIAPGAGQVVTVSYS